MNKTKIDWCDSTWNPVTGCLHGCEYCYARKMVDRLIGKREYGNIFEENEPVIGANGRTLAYPHSFSPTLLRYHLSDYIGKKGRNIFVCSMADLFGNWVPDSWIEEVFKACEKAPQHNYLFLTKNPQRYDKYGVKPYTIRGVFNLWYGMSVTNESDFGHTWKLPEYCNTFVSIEPLLEDLQIVKGDLRFSCLDWVIIGAETGQRKDKVVPKRKWIEDIVNECSRQEIPVFMKSSLEEIWGESLVQEFPEQLKGENASDKDFKRHD